MSLKSILFDNGESLLLGSYRKTDPGFGKINHFLNFHSNNNNECFGKCVKNKKK